MVTKYVCIMEGCNFVTEDADEAKRHGETAHPGTDHAGVKLTIDDENNIDCELM